MAINLLGYVAPQSATALTTPTKTQTSTPSVISYQTTNAQGLPSGQINTPLGVNATSPYNNQSAPSTTLPASQVAKAPAPVDTSSFTPAQLAAFNNAASLGSGVQTQNGVVGGNQNTSPPNTDPVTAIPAASVAAAGNTSTGTIGGTAPQASSTSPTTASTTSQPYSATNPVTQSGLLAQAANIASQPSADYLAQQAQANQYNQALQQSYSNEAQAEANIQGAPHTVNFAQGAENVIRNQALTQQQGLSTAYQGAAGLLGAANTQQGQEQTGLIGAANSAAPVQVSPGNYLASPLTGVAASAAAGQQQGIQAATNWAIAQQNMAQGANYQGQAQAISGALQTLAPVQAALTPYMSANNLDSQGQPFYNQQINAINAQSNPAAYATMQAAVSEARSYAIQILGSQSGANPTDVTNSVNSFDFSNFTPTQLNTFLDNLNALGQYRLSEAQAESQAGYGANATVGTPAQGATATPGAPLESGGANSLNNLSDPVKAILGGTVNITGDVLNTLAGSASSAVGSAAGTGIAAKVLGIGG